MMFQWANKQLEKLSETLAPPPSTPAHRYLAAVASHQEDLALSILNDPHEPLDPYSSLNQKGMNALHAAASHGIVNIIRQLIGRGVRVDIADYNGWTALHHASASSSMSAQSALATVKVLVEELGASVVMKDATAQTPYDVGSSQAVRGYLLPKQLQQETQECLDNGGQGLMPGIDMGGMKVNYKNLAPPPVIGTPGGAPPQPSMMNNNDPSAALMQPPPVRGINSNFSPQPPVANNYNAAAASPAMMQPMSSPIPGHNSTSQTAIPPPNNNTVDAQPQQDNQTTSFPEQAPIQTPNQPPQLPNQPPVEVSTQPPQQLNQQTSHSSANQVTPAEQPPKSNNSTASASSGYALRGGNSNSAFVLNESSYASSGRKLYKPDGFHTSSNDKELQAKYGHVENSFETSRKLAVPPPPTSGGANPMASPPPHSGGSNPYSAMGAGNVRTMGYIGGGGRARYPAYCAVSDSVSAPPSLGGQASPRMAQPPAPSYSTFNPSAMQQNQAAAPAGPTQQWAGEQQMQNTYGYTPNQYTAPAVQTQQWSGEQQMQNYAQSNVPAPSPNVASSYAVQSQQTNTQNQYSAPGYTVQQQQHAMPQTIATADGNTTPAMVTVSDAASMFATPHAEEKKAMFPSTGETASTSNTSDVFSSPPPAESNVAETNNTADVFSSPPPATGSANETKDTIGVFSSPPPAESNAADLKQQETANSDVIEPEQTVSEAPATEDASSFFGATSESNAPKAFGGLPPPPVFGSSNASKPVPAPSNAGGTSSLPPPPQLFSNQTPNNNVTAEDEIPTEQFADVSL